MAILVTGVYDVRKLIQNAYALSRPQGLGYLSKEVHELSEEDVNEILRSDGTFDMDYIYGRAVKLRVWKDDGKCFLSDAWFDHSETAFKILLNGSRYE